MLTDIVSNEACQILPHKLKEIISQPIVVKDAPLHVTASIGIAIHPDHGDDLDTFLSTVDKAMYAAKEHDYLVQIIGSNLMCF